jgi:hypothetical protein
MRPALLLLLALVPASTDDPAPVALPESFEPEEREHWAYQPPVRPEVPEVVDSSWPRNPIDQFLLAEMEALDFSPAPEADRVSLLRRVTFDLTGLPPTPEEAAAYLADDRPDAYEQLVDRLLASPRHGERWAQHWLDLAHYADSNGYELDADRPDAWRYRDWVVSSLNADLPYDRFLSLQIAGDEIAPGDPSALIATGFGRCGPREVVSGNIDPEVRRQSELTEVTGTVGSVFLGLTMACARCHDHKFDAIPTTDYYRLSAYFAGAQFLDREIATEDEKKAVEAAHKVINQKLAPIKQAMAELEAPYRARLKAGKEARLTPEENRVLALPKDKRTPQEQKIAAGASVALTIAWEEVAHAVAENPADHAKREALKLQIHQIQQTAPQPPAHAMALVEEGPTPPPTFVLSRGDVKSPADLVEPRPLGVVLANQPFDQSIRPDDKTSGRRRALAAWMTRPDHPLTTRVLVNRLWQHHFGRGLVASPSDFGVRGEPPSHPELLDWLATELVARGWSLKAIHRLMVTSTAYRQASDPLRSVVSDDPADLASLRETFRRQAEDDPHNDLVWRMNRRRMEAESLRDSLLAATGELNPRMGGAGVKAPIEKEIEDLIFTEAEVVDLWPEDPNPAEYDRRSLYLYKKRNVRYPMFDAFDSPDTQSACAVRDRSTHALQSLVLLNGAFSIDRAKALAGRVLADAADDIEARVSLLYSLTLTPPPPPAEHAQAASFLAEQADSLAARCSDDSPPLAQPIPEPAGLPPAEAAAWVDLAMAMLNRNEFLYIP